MVFFMLYWFVMCECCLCCLGSLYCCVMLVCYVCWFDDLCFVYMG